MVCDADVPDGGRQGAVPPAHRPGEKRLPHGVMVMNMEHLMFWFQVFGLICVILGVIGLALSK
jgi:hypothetical protein